MSSSAAGWSAGASSSADYVDGMKLREETVSTYLGNGVAMPHGTFEAKDAVTGTGIVVAQYPDGIDWGAGTAHLVIGLAAIGDDHVHVLSQMAEVLQDEDLCQELWITKDSDLLFNTLTGSLSNGDGQAETPEAEVVITNPAGLHARPATLIVALAKKSGAAITISKGSKVAKAGSIMSVLALGATSGDTVAVSATADDPAVASEAVKDIVDILTAVEG